MTSDAADLQSRDQAGQGAAQECALIEADLERLKSLINDAGERLLLSFNEIAAVLPTLATTDAQRAQVVEAVHTAVTALQFQDMATQLTGHAQRRLSVLEERLRSLSDDAARGLQMVQSHPVRQVEMTAGSIDLF
jgi:chromosome segregation ATPase